MKKILLALALILGMASPVLAQTSVNIKGDTVKVANDTENQLMWESYEFGRPGVFVNYFNEFTDWVADAWTVTEVGTSTQNLADEANGVLQLITGGTENNGNTLQLGGTGDAETTGESWAPVAEKDLYFEARVKITEVTENDFFIGLHVQDTAITASEGSDLIGFLKADGSTSLTFKTSASSVDSTETAHTMVDDTYVVLGYYCNGTTSCTAWVNEDEVATISTNIPTALMKLSVEILAGDDNADTLSVDYIHLAQER